MVDVGTIGIADCRIGETPVAEVRVGESLVWANKPKLWMWYFGAKFDDYHSLSSRIEMSPYSFTANPPSQAESTYTIEFHAGSYYSETFTAKPGATITISVSQVSSSRILYVKSKEGSAQEQTLCSIVYSGQITSGLVAIKTDNIRFDYLIDNCVVGAQITFSNQGGIAAGTKFYFKANTPMTAKITQGKDERLTVNILKAGTVYNGNISGKMTSASATLKRSA